jgi:TRAP-type C4-dicarboxylate transport system permease small subunit
MVFKMLDKTTSAITKISTIVLILTGIIVLANIILRAVFNSPLSGTVEAVQYGMMTCAGLILCRTGLKRRHVAVTLAIDALPKRLANVFRVFVNLISAAVFGIIAYYYFITIPVMAATSRTSEVLKFPTYILYIILAICFLIAMIVFLYWAVVHAIGIVKPDKSEMTKSASQSE